MAQSLPVEIISDDDNSSPLFKRSRDEDWKAESAVVILDDDPTPEKPNRSSLSTPISPDVLLDSDVSIIKCSARISSDPNITATATTASEKDFSGVSGLIFLESDNESEDGHEKESLKTKEDLAGGFVLNSEMSPSFLQSEYHPYNSTHIIEERYTRGVCSAEKDQYQVDHEANVMMQHLNNSIKQKDKSAEANMEKNTCKDEAMARKKKTKEEKIRLAEERKLKREQERLQKEAMKAEALEMKKLQKEQQKWEKGKFALKSIVAEIDAKAVELGAIGGHLLSRFAEKGLSFRITSNPIERSILWTIAVPEQLSKHLSKGLEVPYVLLLYEAEEFCSLVLNESILDHVSRIQHHYPSHTICYLTNKLMAYINKREQAQYKNRSDGTHWRRPPVEEMLARLSTNFSKVHSRHCRDEAEIADHIVGLTCSLATCQFRKKLTRLSINANGSHVPKDFIDRNLIKKSIWLKALVAIPKVQPRFAVAIWKKYPTMKSLLRVYMDPSKSVHEKEILLRDLPTEGLLGQEDRRVGEICSKRVYRILMAQNGNIKTDDVEDGADFFRS